MNKKEAILDINRLKLVLKHCTPKEVKKLNNRLNNLFNGFSPKSIKLITLLDKFNSTNINIEELPPYSIGNRKVSIIRKDSQVEKAVKEICKESFIGFDTEQKPTFRKGEKQKDISIIQMATKNNCYIFQMRFIKNKTLISQIISNKNIRKLGFGLKNDNKELIKQFNVHPANLFDISPFIKYELLHRHQIGAKAAVALFLDQKLNKSKKVVLSNWENDHLSDNQVKYASEDATAPYDVYENITTNFNYILN